MYTVGFISKIICYKFMYVDIVQDTNPKKKNFNIHKFETFYHATTLT